MQTMFLSLDRNHYELAVTIVLLSFVLLAAGAPFAMLHPERGLQVTLPAPPWCCD
jgi:hypothetical protein